MKTKLFLATAALLTSGVFTQISLAADEAPPPGRPSREEMIKRFDTNGDGKLDQTEREALRAEMEKNRGAGPEDRAGPGGPLRERAIERFDKDGDGKLNEAERAELASRPRAMERIDTNKDGKISDEEWAAARDHLRERRGEGPGAPEGKAKRKDRDNRR